MLSNPVLENGVNQEAVHMLKHAPRAYYQMVCDCVAASKEFEGRFLLTI